MSTPSDSRISASFSVADPGFPHHRDRHFVDDLGDVLGVGHPRDAAALDIGRDGLERHHRDRTGILRDSGLLARDDVHDDPPFFASARSRA